MVRGGQMETKVNCVEVKKILGKSAEDLTDDELKVCVAKLQQLVEWILDEYEKQVFGKTIRELA